MAEGVDAEGTTAALSPAWPLDVNGRVEERRDEASPASEASPLRAAEPKWWVRHALAGGLLLAFGAVLFGISRTRGVDGDEPYYATAVDSIARGKRLYVDFFHPQGPVQPLLYSLFYRIGLHGLGGLRAVSVGCCVVAGLTWWRFLTRLRPKLTAAPLCLLAMALADSAYFGWGASLKTYPLTTMLTAVGSYTWWEGFRHSRSRAARYWFALSGVVWTLAAGARGTFAASALVLSLVLAGQAAWSFFVHEQRSFEDLAAWCVGAAAGTSVTAFQWLRDPSAFWFDNVTVQKLRDTPPKGWARFEYLFYFVHDQVIGFPWLTFVIVGGTACALALAFTPAVRGDDARQRADRSLVAIPLAGLAYLGAMLGLHPQYGQYYEGSLGAFFVPCVFACVARRAEAVPPGVYALVAGLLLCISAKPFPDANSDVGRLDTTASIGRLIARNSRAGDQVWGFHSLWAFQAGRTPVSGMECQYGYAPAQTLRARERRHLHLLSVKEVADVLARRIPKIAVTDAGTWVLNPSPEDAKRVDQELSRSYRVIREQGAVKVWLRNDAPVVPES